MLFFLQSMILNLHIKIITKFFFPPLKKLLSSLLPKIQNCIRNITIYPRCYSNNILFIFSNHLTRYPWHPEIKTIHIPHTGQFGQIFISIKILCQKHHIRSSIWIFFSKLLLFWSIRNVKFTA